MDKLYYNAYLDKNRYKDIDKIDYSKFDSKFLKKMLNDYDELKGVVNVYDNGLLEHFIYDVSEAIDKCDFTDVQVRRLVRWFHGYNENDIAKEEGVSRWVVSKSIHAGCEKILTILKSQ